MSIVPVWANGNEPSPKVSKDSFVNKSMEYSVYIHHFPEGKSGQNHYWEKTKTTRNERRALRNAEKLFESGQYQRVEVKKRFFDRRSGRRVGTTIKIYESRTPFEITSPVVWLSILLFISVILSAFLAASVFGVL